MNYIVYSVGKTKNASLANLEQAYVKRLKQHHTVELRYVKDSSRLTAAVGDSSAYVIAMDERGTEYTTHKFRAQLENVHTETVVFVIGDTDGLDPTLIKQANSVMALSKMTFTHEMARVLLLEQLYRVTSIQIGHPYHRD